MGDNNEFTDLQNPGQEQPLQTNIEPNKDQTTYWEVEAANQNLEQPQVDTTTEVNEGLQPDGQPSFTPMYQQPPKKKGHRKLVALFVVFILLLAGVSTAFAFQDTLKNTFALMTKSPAEYYAYVEKESLYQSVDEIKPYLNFSQQKIAYGLTSDITFDRDAINSLLQSSLGTSMEDIESNLGIPIKNLGFDLLFASDGGKIKENVGVRFNSVNIITMELFMDTLKEEMLISLPELSSAYLKQSLSTDEFNMGTYLKQLEKLTPDRSADLINRYGSIIAGNINEVKLEKDAQLNLKALSVKCNKLTVTIDQAAANGILKAVFDEAKEDEYIFDLLPAFQMTKEDYLKAIDEAQVELKNSLTSSSDESLQMVVYVDSQGNIIGRDFTVKEAAGSLAAFGYQMLNKGQNGEYKIYLKDETGSDILNITGSQTKSNDVYDGSATIQVNASSFDLPSNISFDLTYEDYRIEKKDNRFYQYGTITLSSLDLMGIQFIIKNDVVNDEQQNKLVVQMGASPLITIDSKLKYKNDDTIVAPPADAETYDMEESDKYLATFDLDTYISDLSDRLGVDLQSIIDNFTGGYSY